MERDDFSQRAYWRGKLLLGRWLDPLCTRFGRLFSVSNPVYQKRRRIGGDALNGDALAGGTAVADGAMEEKREMRSQLFPGRPMGAFELTPNRGTRAEKESCNSRGFFCCTVVLFCSNLVCGAAWPPTPRSLKSSECGYETVG